MAIKTLKENEVVGYIPESERGKKDATVFWIRQMSLGERESWTRRVTTRIGKKGRIETNDADIRKKMFLEKVEKVENILLSGKNKSETIDTPEDIQKLWDILPAEVGVEVLDAIQNESTLAEGLVKNSVS